MSRNLFLFRAFRSAAAIGFLMLLAQPGQAADDPLSLFKNYFLTGDYASAGVGLRGKGLPDSLTGTSLAKGEIVIPTCQPGQIGLSCVPGGADIVAAFLYWESIEKTAPASSAVGYVTDPNPTEDPQLKCDRVIGSGSVPTRCTIVGKPIGGEHAAPCWSSGGSTGSSQGAPTLRVYRADVLRYLPLDAWTKKKVPTITVWLSDSGSNGSGVPLTEGASLVVVYREPTLVFKGIVIFNGSFTMNNSTDSLNQTLKGFYQASTSTDLTAKITHIVGDGQPNFPERLWFADAQLPPNPFIGSADGSVVPSATGGLSWDNLTYDVSQYVKKLVSDAGSAALGSVNTKVDHGSGSFDCLSWGAIVFSTTVQDTDEDGLLDVWETDGFRDLTTGAVLVSLPGASKLHKDLYVEIDHMQDFAAKTAHSEKPSKEAIDLVGDAFKNAPVSNPDGVTGINVHFDLGLNPYPITTPPDPYITSTGTFGGGDVIDERNASFFCTSYSATSCLFPSQPGLVFWKQGIRHIKENYSDPNRDFLFHYVVFGHALAMKALDEHGDPIPFEGGFLASTVSGRADLFGRDVAVTLGKWTTRTKINEAGTLLHELAHNLGGYHGGTPTGFNCTTNHVGVLNYLYQNAGVVKADGTTIVDLSREVLPAPTGNENSLNEFQGLGAGSNMQYRLRWYAPRSNVAAFLSVDPTSLRLPKAHCDGSKLASGEIATLVRVDAFNVARKPIDWDYSGSTATNATNQDLDFDGIIETDNFTPHYTGVNDWYQLFTLNHGLQQIDAGRSLFGLSLGVGIQDLLQSGQVELGQVELGQVELGQVELGQVELGQVELGQVELGQVELGEVELGAAGLGEVAAGASDEIDEPTAEDIGQRQPPSNLSATRTSQSIILSWTAAPGNVVAYTIYRSTGIQIATPISKFGPFPATSTTFTDGNVRNSDAYTYFVTATFDDGTISSSNQLNVPRR